MKRVTVLLRVLGIATFCLIASLSSAFMLADTMAAADYGTPVAGQSIYDRAGVLTPIELAQLDAKARAVRDAGAPVVVYLQARDASENETERDASDLMDVWNIQSAPDAKDGLVIFLNLKPDDLHHGRVALYSGETHADGNLPQRELQRIIDKEMTPLLSGGNLAAGIAAGLDAASHDLAFGPPPPPEPSSFQKAAKRLSDGPLSIVTLLSVAAAAVASWVIARGYSRSRVRSSVPISPTTTLPDRMPPASVGALLNGRISDQQMEGTILDLARRGGLAIEPAGKRKAQVRLIDASIVANDVERAVWSGLEMRADDGVVTGRDLARVRGTWGPAKDALRIDLVNRGWFDPTTGQRRHPIYLAAIGAMLAGVIALIVTIASGTPWGFVGFALLETVGVAGIVIAYSIPNTSAAGEEAVAQWRSYVTGIKASRRDKTLGADLDLDEAMPFAVAAGAAGSLDKRLKEASKQGYAPAWLGPSLHNTTWDGGFYPYWIAFHGSVTPSSSGSSSSGASAGGAGASGSF